MHARLRVCLPACVHACSLANLCAAGQASRQTCRCQSFGWLVGCTLVCTCICMLATLCEFQRMCVPMCVRAWVCAYMHTGMRGCVPVCVCLASRAIKTFLSLVSLPKDRIGQSFESKPDFEFRLLATVFGVTCVTVPSLLSAVAFVFCVRWACNICLPVQPLRLCATGQWRYHHIRHKRQCSAQGKCGLLPSSQISYFMLR